jgi:hypothetical protein
MVRALTLGAAVIGWLIINPAFAADSIRPDRNLTPGAFYDDITQAQICTSGYSKRERHTSAKLKRRVFLQYGIDKNKGHYEVDHLIPLSLGGADEKDNLWPESYDTQPWNASVKDRLEDWLHTEVCSGRVPLAVAQAEFANDWIVAYQKYLGDPAAW